MANSSEFAKFRERVWVEDGYVLLRNNDELQVIKQVVPVRVIYGGSFAPRLKLRKLHTSL